MSLTLLLASGLSLYSYATESVENINDIAIESNSYTNWPIGPKVNAESALLIEADTGTVLYEKNIHARLFPASITKLLTALVVIDNCSLNDMVTFSQEAIDSINWMEDANIGISAGSSISVEECLYGLLVGSANEVAYALAEHVSGNIQDFSKLMNAYAADLGCVDSHFVSPNGIHDDNHYTSAYDMSLIARKFFANELLTRISSTTSHHIPKTSTQKREDMVVYAKSKLLPGKEYYYEPLIGTKTGYTEYARQTLVSCASNNSMKLICVVLKEENPMQYTDTIDLFRYGFSNFQPMNIADNDSNFSEKNSNFFSDKNLIFGNNNELFSIDSSSRVFLPVGASFNELLSQIVFDRGDDSIARMEYTYYGHSVGYGDIKPIVNQSDGFGFYNKIAPGMEATSNNRIIVINAFVLIMSIIIVGILIGTINSIIYRIIRKRKNNKISLH